MAISFVPSLSFAALTVTVRAVSQLPAVKTSRVGLAERRFSAPVMSTVTLPPTGSVASRTVYVLLFSSGTVREVADRVMAGVSSSVTLAVKLPDTLLNSLLGVVAAACVMVTVSSKPSSSCWALRVTVCGVFQFALVNVSVFWSPGVSVSVSPTVTEDVSPLVMVAVTVCVGSALRRTV